MTLANIASKGVRPVSSAWFAATRPNSTWPEMAQRYGAETTVPDWHARLFCSQCGSRQVDIAVSEA